MELLLYTFKNIHSIRTFFKEASKGNMSLHKNSTGTNIILNETYVWVEFFLKTKDNSLFRSLISTDS